jgi:hypothetical protein
MPKADLKRTLVFSDVVNLESLSRSVRVHVSGPTSTISDWRLCPWSARDF